ncbi:MAG: polyhydroxyalkanoate depolymerase [Geminicoccaceae bacterium]
MQRALHASAHLIELYRDVGEPRSDSLLDVLERHSGEALHENTLQSTPFCTVRAFRREGETPARRVLLVAPLSGYTTSLQSDLIAALLPHQEVIVTDWHDARLIPLAAGGFSLDDQVLFVERLLRELGPDLHLVGVSQGCLAAFTAVSLLAGDAPQAAPFSLSLLGGPIDTDRSPKPWQPWFRQIPETALEHSMLVEVPARFPGVGRKVYPGYVQLAFFLNVTPTLFREAALGIWYARQYEDRAVQLYQASRLFDDLHAVMDIPGEVFLQSVMQSYSRDALGRQRVYVQGRHVEPLSLGSTALLTMEAERDELVGADQTHAAHGLCWRLRDQDRAMVTLPDARHYELFNGARVFDSVAPALYRFMVAHERGKARLRSTAALPQPQP